MQAFEREPCVYGYPDNAVMTTYIERKRERYMCMRAESERERERGLSS
jgi:hypothetical protein